MLHSQYIYKGFHVGERRILADAENMSLIHQYAKELIPNLVTSDSTKDHRNAKCLEIRGSLEWEEIKGVIADFEQLEFLSVPDKLVKYLSSLAIMSLKTVQITGMSRTKLPAKFSSLSLERIVAAESVVDFDKDQIPNVRYFLNRLDRGGKLLSEIAKFDKVEALSLTDITSITVVPLAEWPDVRYLRIMVSKLASLEQISKFPRITDLKLHDNPHLTDLSSIRDIETLRELTLAYCSSLTSIEPLRDLKLKKLSIYGCNGLRKEEVLRIVDSLHLDEKVINL